MNTPETNQITSESPSGDADCSLLPCPFCGSAAKWIDRDGWGWDASCENKDCIASSGFDWYLSKELIAPMWNRRENTEHIDRKVQSSNLF